MADRSRRRFLRTVASSAALGLVVVALPTGASADGTTPATTPATAPAGFADEVVSTYQSEFAAAQALGQANALAPVSDYQQQVSALSPGALDALYNATRQVPAWSQIPALMQAVAADTSAGARGAPVAHASSKAAPADGAPAPSVAPFQPANCDSGPPASAVFATQIVLDAGSALYNILSVDGQLGNKSSYFIAAFTGGVISAAAVVHDTLVFLQGDGADCAASNTAGYLTSIDSLTAKTFDLTTSIAGAISSLQPLADGTASLRTMADGTAASIQAVQTTVAGLQASGAQLLQDQTTIQSALGGDIAALSGQLETNRLGIQSDLSNLTALATANNQAAVTALANSTATIQTGVTAALSQTLDETDSTAAALEQLLAGNAAQLVAALSAGSTTERRDFEKNLTLDIEQGLAAAHPQLRLKLPASVGGYLDSAPVGVASVVQKDIRAIQAANPQAASAAAGLVDAARSALAQRKYFDAFSDFQQAYLALAGG